MKFLYADTQDYVDPEYDFLNDRNAPGRKRYWDDQYAHEMMSPAPYDGLLVSMSAVRPAAGVSNSKVRYSTAEQQRFLREGARKFLRLNGQKFKDAMVMGDCGAFAYVEHPTPAYAPAEVVDFYADGGFTHGCSPDHIIFNCDSSNPPAEDQDDDIIYRYNITLANAKEFLRLTNEAGRPFEPLGAVQGWSPKSMAAAAKSLEDMGYRYLAIGGLVPLKVEQIHEVLKELRASIKAETNIHLLGFAKAERIHEFTNYGITSFDSTSPLIRAFKDAKSNYYLENTTSKLDYYTAIRIPQAIENPKLMQGIKRGVLSAEALQEKEAIALQTLRDYDKGLADYEATISALSNYLRLTLSGSIASTEELEKEVAKSIRLIRPTLIDKPWKKCQCSICQSAGVETIIFRASNRNKRRGFHNLGVYHRHLQRTLEKARNDLSI
ncbi:queuine tRNA-ribosyltransferase [Pseudomonas sp. THAF187a]|uniref:tRNA-guanine transglycosylase DpdA n=1 Tax=unclassified Pseudomonas TaxID=196821 RepID=UPI0012683A9C|nr:MULTISPECIES: tRNA-guanine transglycosylase DpdA [unclassified Pseudomonas]QFT22655.1 queuine tRNA-ribosyltransferase [Pseudomonas sp. THAF187a]QFT42842.1 queuine tRNA-ribosyltransferase [Pseudomonas sp. THAF42]